jgi:hypothetical protein
MPLNFYSLFAAVVLSTAAGLGVAVIGGSTQTTGTPTGLGPRVGAFIVDHLRMANCWMTRMKSLFSSR